MNLETIERELFKRAKEQAREVDLDKIEPAFEKVSAALEDLTMKEVTFILTILFGSLVNEVNEVDKDFEDNDEKLQPDFFNLRNKNYDN